MDALPDWATALAVVAHPDDESFGLGGILAALVDAGTSVRTLVLTRGEASTLGEGDLASVRATELAEATRRLGLDGVEQLHHPDGGLSDVDPELLEADIAQRLDGVDGLVVFGPGGITGHPDHVTATEAARRAAAASGIPVLGWVLPTSVAAALNAEHGTSFVGVAEPDLRLRVDRARQAAAIEAHPSQISQVVWRRLQLSGAEDWAVWL